MPTTSMFASFVSANFVLNVIGRSRFGERYRNLAFGSGQGSREKSWLYQNDSDGGGDSRLVADNTSNHAEDGKDSDRAVGSDYLADWTGGDDARDNSNVDDRSERGGVGDKQAC